MRLFHGTGFAFQEFDNLPMFFTDNFEAASGYARSSADRPFATCEPRVIEVEVEWQHPVIYDIEQFRARFGDERIAASCCWVWEGFYNVSWDHLHVGHDAVIVRGAEDYLGTFDKERRTAQYDQYLLSPLLPRKIVSIHDVGWGE